eukprot:579458-Ditylum_brightwellii.AAC.1
MSTCTNEFGKHTVVDLPGGLYFVVIWIDAPLDPHHLVYKVADDSYSVLEKWEKHIPEDAVDLLVEHDWARNASNFVRKAFEEKFQQMKKVKKINLHLKRESVVKTPTFISYGRPIHQDADMDDADSSGTSSEMNQCLEAMRHEMDQARSSHAQQINEITSLMTIFIQNQQQFLTQNASQSVTYQGHAHKPDNLNKAPNYFTPVTSPAQKMNNDPSTYPLPSPIPDEVHSAVNPFPSPYPENVHSMKS